MSIALTYKGDNRAHTPLLPALLPSKHLRLEFFFLELTKTEKENLPPLTLSIPSTNTIHRLTFSHVNVFFEKLTFFL